MSKLTAYTFTTLNGYYKAPNEDISWHTHGAEEGEYAAAGAQSDSILLFGRVTYQMMASFWPTPQALETMPEVAKGMNASEKIVFSRTLTQADWQNTRLIKNNIIEEIRKLKQTSGKDMTILGSGSIVTQFAEHGLIDEYQIMIDPVALGNGTPLFQGITHPLTLTLTNTKIFKSGVVLLCYQPKETTPQ